MDLTINARPHTGHDCIRYGQKPDIREALELASYVEDSILKRPLRSLSGGWMYQEQIAGGSNMQMFVFARMGNDVIEYALVNKGTDFRSPADALNNIFQFLGLSRDMQASIACARAFVECHTNSTITFIGHSKGGAEAAANAIITNRNAIILNPMRLTLTGKISKYLARYEGAVDVFAVAKDPLRMLFGWTEGIPGTYSLLPSLTTNPHRLEAIECGLTQISIPDRIVRTGIV